MSSNARPQTSPPRKPMLRLDESRRPSRRAATAVIGMPPAQAPLAEASPDCPRLSFVPDALPRTWFDAARMPVAVRQAQALSDDERLAAAAMYMWLRNRAVDQADGPLVLQCDTRGWPLLDGDGLPLAIDGGRLDGSLIGAMDGDR